MTLLDRFRTAPRQKHPDPAVRLAYVAEIPLDDRETIAAMAREDEDPRVRRAAVSKLMEPAILGRIAGEDADEGVRAHAATMLREIALEAFEGPAEAEALDAVDAIADQRALTQIARTATREIVALRALSRLTDPHAWGTAARHAVDEATRRGALERLRDRGDASEILAVAMNGEYKDTALASTDLVTDREQLEQIALRGKNKTAAKRARTIIREADEQAARASAEAAAAAAEMAALARADAEAASRADLATRADAAVRAGAGDETLERNAGAGGTDTGSSPSGDGSGDGVVVDPEAQAEQARTEQADREARRAQDEQARAARESARQARLVEIAAEAATAWDDGDPAAGMKRFGLARREWKDLAAGLDVEASVAARFDEVATKFLARETETREAEERSRREALARIQHLLTRVEGLAAKADLSLKAADRALRDVRTAMGALPPLPSRQDAEDVGRRLKAVQGVLTPKLQELREADDWQRWANAGVQEQLCAKMEALQAVEDPEAIARDVRELQEQWRKSADVPRAQADALWRRFKAAHDAVWPRCEAHFAAEARVRAENLAQKIALCEKAELLSESTSWIQTSEEIKRLQAEWKTIGAVPRGREKAIWDRFRTGCDRFFTRRHEDLAQRKAVWSGNLALKVALCEKAESLAQSTDWDATAGELKRLQAEWKTIGPVKKTRSEAIWQRFRAACDLFFSRYAQRHDLAREERVAAREAICAELAALAPEAPAPASPEPAASEPAASVFAGDSTESGAPAVDDAETASSPEAAPALSEPAAPPPDLLATVRGLRARWQQEIAARGVDPERARALDERFAATYARVVSSWPAAFAGTDLDPDANRKRMESLVHRMEDLARSVAGPASAKTDDALSPTTRLAAMLKEALAANTIGGKVEDDTRVRAALEEVRQAQASWSRIGPVPDAARKPLYDRFQRACRRISDTAAAKAAQATRTVS